MHHGRSLHPPAHRRRGSELQAGARSSADERQRRNTPCSPESRINRATRLRPVEADATTKGLSSALHVHAATARPVVCHVTSCGSPRSPRATTASATARASRRLADTLLSDAPDRAAWTTIRFSMPSHARRTAGLVALRGRPIRRPLDLLSGQRLDHPAAQGPATAVLHTVPTAHGGDACCEDCSIWSKG